jgi:hypothetical protein
LARSFQLGGQEAVRLSHGRFSAAEDVVHQLAAIGQPLAAAIHIVDPWLIHQEEMVGAGPARDINVVESDLMLPTSSSV